MTKLQFIVLGVLVLFIGMCAMSTIPTQDDIARVDRAVALIDSLDLRDFTAYYTSQERLHMEDQREFREFRDQTIGTVGACWARLDSLEAMCQSQ